MDGYGGNQYSGILQALHSGGQAVNIAESASKDPQNSLSALFLRRAQEDEAQNRISEALLNGAQNREVTQNTLMKDRALQEATKKYYGADNLPDALVGQMRAGVSKEAFDNHEKTMSLLIPYMAKDLNPTSFGGFITKAQAAAQGMPASVIHRFDPNTIIKSGKKMISYLTADAGDGTKRVIELTTDENGNTTPKDIPHDDYMKIANEKKSNSLAAKFSTDLNTMLAGVEDASPEFKAERANDLLSQWHHDDQASVYPKIKDLLYPDDKKSPKTFVDHLGRIYKDDPKKLEELYKAGFISQEQRANIQAQARIETGAARDATNKEIAGTRAATAYMGARSRLMGSKAYQRAEPDEKLQMLEDLHDTYSGITGATDPIEITPTQKSNKKAPALSPDEASIASRWKGK